MAFKSCCVNFVFSCFETEIKSWLLSTLPLSWFWSDICNIGQFIFIYNAPSESKYNLKTNKWNPFTGTIDHLPFPSSSRKENMVDLRSTDPKAPTMGKTGSFCCISVVTVIFVTQFKNVELHVSETSNPYLIRSVSCMQFPDTVDFCEEMANSGKTVIVAALDGTFQRKVGADACWADVTKRPTQWTVLRQNPNNRPQQQMSECAHYTTHNSAFLVIVTLLSRHSFSAR